MTDTKDTSELDEILVVLLFNSKYWEGVKSHKLELPPSIIEAKAALEALISRRCAAELEEVNNDIEKLELDDLREKFMADLKSFQVDEALVDGDTLINLDFLITDLLAYVEPVISRRCAAARLDEVRNAKVVHMDMPKDGIKKAFDDWCFIRQEEINDGKPARYEYDPEQIDEYRRRFEG